MRLILKPLFVLAGGIAGVYIAQQPPASPPHPAPVETRVILSGQDPAKPEQREALDQAKNHYKSFNTNVLAAVATRQESAVDHALRDFNAMMAALRKAGFSPEKNKQDLRYAGADDPEALLDTVTGLILFKKKIRQEQDGPAKFESLPVASQKQDQLEPAA